jgi:signal transduction histidine kinase
VTDDGTGDGSAVRLGESDAAAPRAAPTYGLVGMTERAVALGGRLEHGGAARGGFRVRAVLPTTVVATEPSTPSIP